MKRYASYIFDFDGTTFDSRGSMQSVFSHAFKAIGYGPVTYEQAVHFMHQSLPETLEECGVPKERLQAFVDAIEEAIDREETIAQNAPFPETFEVFASLQKEGKPLMIVSGNTVEHISRVLKHHEVPVPFKSIVGSDVCREHHKPEPEPLLLAMSALPNLSKSDFVYIGDSLQDMECANRAGIDGIFIDRNEEFPEYRGTTIKSLKDLLG